MCFVSMSGNFQEDLDQGTMIMLMLDLNHVIGTVRTTVTVLVDTNLVGMKRSVMVEMKVLQVLETVV